MKKVVSLVVVLWLGLLHGYAEEKIGAVPAVGETELRTLHELNSQNTLMSARSAEPYRIFIVITSQSDWTTVQIVNGYTIAHYEMTEGYTAPGLECWFDTHLNLMGMTKKQFDTTLVRIEVTAILYVEKGSDLTLEIKKGDIGYTAVEIYNYNGEEPGLVETFTHDTALEGDPENRVEFSIPDTITTGGPLPLLFYPVPPLVWAFYYPWYYKEQWATSDVLIDNPLVGAHDSSDLRVIETHINQAKSVGIDGFIVSWWGEGHYTDENLKVILDVAQEYDFKISVYLESLQGNGEPRSEKELERMVLSFFRKYGDDTRVYRIDGNPVIFVWAVKSHPPSVWESVITDVEGKGYSGIYLAETGNPHYLDVFNGLHRYGTVGIDDLSLLYERLSLVCRTYGYLHGKEQYIWAATACPGYDDRNIPGRTGLYQSRENGAYYRDTFEAALASSPDWILITSFNEWWENTHIEPSVNYGATYLEMTSDFSSEFKGESTPLEKADSLFEQGIHAFDEGNYEDALEFFQRAKEIYESIGSEKAKECDEWIQKVEDGLNGFCLGTVLMGALVGTGFLMNFFQKWKRMIRR